MPLALMSCKPTAVQARHPTFRRRGASLTISVRLRWLRTDDIVSDSLAISAAAYQALCGCIGFARTQVRSPTPRASLATSCVLGRGEARADVNPDLLGVASKEDGNPSWERNGSQALIAP